MWDVQQQQHKRKKKGQMLLIKGIMEASLITRKVRKSWFLHSKKSSQVYNQVKIFKLKSKLSVTKIYHCPQGTDQTDFSHGKLGVFCKYIFTWLYARKLIFESLHRESLKSYRIFACFHLEPWNLKYPLLQSSCLHTNLCLNLVPKYLITVRGQFYLTLSICRTWTCLLAASVGSKWSHTSAVECRTLCLQQNP